MCAALQIFIASARMYTYFTLKISSYPTVFWHLAYTEITRNDKITKIYKTRIIHRLNTLLKHHIDNAQ